MKQNKLFLGLATIAAALTFASCSSDEPELNSQQPKQANTISFTSTVSNGSSGTRASSEYQTNSLNTNTSVGIYGVTTGTTTAIEGNSTNAQYNVGESNALTAAGTAMQWPTSGNIDLYAYAPYQSGWTTIDDANTFSIQTDQSSEANYVKSDLLWATPVTNQAQANNISLTFGHKLSRIAIVVKKGDSFSETLSGATVTIENTKTATTFNPKTGVLGDASTVASITAGALTATVDGDSKTETLYAVLVPQTIAANTLFVKVATASKTYTATLASEATLASGNTYTFTVTIVSAASTRANIDFSTGNTLNAWGTDANATITGVESPETLMASFGTLTSGQDASYANDTYYWWNGSNNLMQIFSISNGELANFSTLHYTLSNFTKGTLRIRFDNGDSGLKTINPTAGYHEINLSELGIDLSKVTKISFGGTDNTDGASKDNQSSWYSAKFKASDVYLTK